MINELPAPSGSREAQGSRYCEMCDLWMSKSECPECGMPTRKKAK